MAAWATSNLFAAHEDVKIAEQDVEKAKAEYEQAQHEVLMSSITKDFIRCRTVLRPMMIRNILIITVITALVPTAMSNVSGW
jgi:hypothetical protein